MFSNIGCDRYHDAQARCLRLVLVFVQHSLVVSIYALQKCIHDKLLASARAEDPSFFERIRMQIRGVTHQTECGNVAVGSRSSTPLLYSFADVDTPADGELFDDLHHTNEESIGKLREYMIELLGPTCGK